jgi:hypothetical protein
MKKWIIGFVVILCLAVCSIYIFIPSTITISNVRYIKTFRTAVAKFITSSEKMNQCLESVAVKSDSGFSYRGFNFKVSKIMYNANEINISSGNVDLISHLIPSEITADSSSLVWITGMKAGTNPFERIRTYYNAQQLKKSMAGLMDQMKTYLDDHKNIYGITVQEIELKDSVLISTKNKSATEPGIADIYKEVKKLEAYAASQNATATNSPMLNVQKIDSAHFEYRVGLPINKITTETADIHIMKMPYKGKMLITEIKGGPHSIKNGLKMLDIYKEDAKRTSPAIYYELMVTNRAVETDTTKWITKLYYPVM